jgi:hypothetical protein
MSRQKSSSACCCQRAGALDDALLISVSSAFHPQYCWGLHKFAKVSHQRNIGKRNTVAFNRTVRSMHVTKRMKF